LAKEMAKFNGKIGEDGLSQSDYTSVTGGTQQQQSFTQQQNAGGGIPRKQQSASGSMDMEDLGDGSIDQGDFSKGLQQLDGGAGDSRIEEDNEHEDAYISKQEQEEERIANFFRDPKNNYEKYDPK
jgi:hypothetical protein